MGPASYRLLYATRASCCAATFNATGIFLDARNGDVVALTPAPMVAGMASDAAITAAVNAASTLALTATQMLALVRSSMASALTDGKAVLRSSANGTSIEVTYEQLLALEKHYLTLSIQEASDAGVGGISFAKVTNVATSA
jgi:methionine aminopeptidase